MRINLQIGIAATALALGLSVPMTQSSAQENARVRPLGLRLEVGLVDPDNASSSVFYGARLNLGSVWKPWLLLGAGATHWSSETDRNALQSTGSGTVSDTRVFTTFGIEPFQISGIHPYLNLGFAAHFVSVEIADDPGLGNALDGTKYGPELGLGLSSTVGRLRLSAEARREFVDDFNNWSFQVGIGTQWGGGPEEDSEIDDASIYDLAVQDPTAAASMNRHAEVIKPDMDQLPVVAEQEKVARQHVEALRVAELERENRELQSRLIAIESRMYHDATAAQGKTRRELAQALEQLVAVSKEKMMLQDDQNALLLTFRTGVLFDPGQARLQPGAFANLSQLAEILTRFPASRVVVEGHTDSSGARGQNIDLSVTRGQTVSGFLIRNGVSSDRIEVMGYGPDYPIAENSSAFGRSQNRRVEIRIISPTSPK